MFTGCRVISESEASENQSHAACYDLCQKRDLSPLVPRILPYGLHIVEVLPTLR